MEGFRLINADYQAQVRTEVHRSKIDEISEKISGKLHIFQPEVIAAAAGVAVFFAQKATTSVLRAGLPILGGALASGTFAGLKEHNRVAVDRAEQARRIARGEQIGNTKYDRQMSETEYKSYEANELTQTLDEAIKSGNTDDMQRCLASIEALTRISDSRKIDLIRFSSGDNTTIEDERLALDVMVAQAKVELKNRGIENNSEVFVDATEKAYERIESDIDAKDAVFKKLQKKRVAAQFAKTAAIGAGAAVAGQEIAAAFNPNSYGLFDKMNDTLGIRFKPLNLGVNNLDAHKTLLAGWLGVSQEQITTTVEMVTAAEATGAKLTNAQIKQLRNEGYTVNERTITSTKNVVSTQKVSAADYARDNGFSIHRQGWAEGNDRLGLWRDSKGDLFTQVPSGAVGPDGTKLVDAAKSGQLRMLLSLSRDSQFTPIEVPGVLNANGQLEFISSDPAINEIIKSGKYAFAEVAYDTGGTVASGAEDMLIYSTHVGTNSVGNLAKEVTKTIVNTDKVYDVIGFERQAEEILKGSDLVDGAVVLPFATRKNLTRGKKGETRKPGETPTYNPNAGLPVEGPNGGGDGGNISVPSRSESDGGTGPDNPTSPIGGDTGSDSPTSPIGGGDVAPGGSNTPSGAGEQQQAPVTEARVERSVGDLSPITLTSEQIRALAREKGVESDYIDTVQSRIEYEKERWNSLTEAQRMAFLAGDFTSLESRDQAEWAKKGIDYLIEYGVLNATEPAEIKMPEEPEDPIFRRTVEADLPNGGRLTINKDGSAFIDVPEDEDALMRRADSYNPITSVRDIGEIVVSDKRIAELNPGHVPSEQEMKRIRNILIVWNRVDPIKRAQMLAGNFDGISKKQAYNNYIAQNFHVLRDFNIISIPGTDADISVNESETLAS